MSAGLFTANTLDYEIGDEVDHERHDEQDHTDQEQDAVMIAALHGFPQLGGDGGRQRADGIQQAGGIWMAWPVHISTAMVSPMARPRPSSTAASRPFFAAGNSTR